jgi:hypothetical protein
MFPAQPFTLYLGDVVWIVTKGAPETVKHRDTIDIEITGIGTPSNPGMCYDNYRGSALGGTSRSRRSATSSLRAIWSCGLHGAAARPGRDAVEFAVSDSRPGPHHPVGGLVGHRARMMARV